MYRTNSEVNFFADINFVEMRNIIPLTVAALLLTAAATMFLTGVEDLTSVVSFSFIVLLGTAAALLLTFSPQEVSAALYATVDRGIQRGATPSEMITMIAMLSDLSRRVGLIGLVDIRTSSKELHEVCSLLASAADEVTIRMQLEKRREVEVAAHRMFFSVLLFTAVYAVVIGVLVAVVQYARMQGMVAVGSFQPVVAHILLPAICGLTLALFVAILMGRMNVAHLREMVSLEVAYQGGAMILEDNNAQRVHARLTK